MELLYAREFTQGERLGTRLGNYGTVASARVSSTVSFLMSSSIYSGEGSGFRPGKSV